MILAPRGCDSDLLIVGLNGPLDLLCAARMKDARRAARTQKVVTRHPRTNVTILRQPGYWADPDPLYLSCDKRRHLPGPGNP